MIMALDEFGKTGAGNLTVISNQDSRSHSQRALCGSKILRFAATVLSPQERVNTTKAVSPIFSTKPAAGQEPGDEFEIETSHEG
jgi:hypothetical protein